MNTIPEFILQSLTQFAGGPGPPENNLVRFGLAAAVWAVLLVIAWSRQHQQKVMRERLLVLGFALALFRELFMLAHLSSRLITGQGHNISCSIVAPFEHGLTLASIIVIAGSFIRYILDNAPVAKQYLSVGLGATAVSVFTALAVWPGKVAENPTIRFHQTWPASMLHAVGVTMIALAIIILVRNKGWLRNVVIVALAMLFFSELLVLINFVSEHQYSRILCPVGNSIYLLAIPLFGLVYYREQADERRQAEQALAVYREHLEDLVRNRTEELLQRNAELAVQNAIAATTSQALNLETVLESALQQTVTPFGLSFGCIFLADTGDGSLALHIFRTDNSGSDLPKQDESVEELREIAEQAANQLHPVSETIGEYNTLDAHTGSRGTEWRVVGIPLIAKGRAIGAMVLGTERATESSPMSEDLLMGVGHQIGVAIEKARLLEQLEKSVVLEERQRIAAEVHDGLAQTLSYLGLRTDLAEEMAAEAKVPQIGAILDDIRTSLAQASSEVRRSIASLQSDPVLPQTLQDSLKQVIDDNGVDDFGSFQIIDELQEPFVMSQDKLDQVVRVVQEAIANAVRHAQANEVQIHLSRACDAIQVQVADDGNGFDPAAVADGDGNHFGLQIMQVRAARLGGRLNVDSHVGQGTRITLIWPSTERVELLTSEGVGFDPIKWTPRKDGILAIKEVSDETSRVYKRVQAGSRRVIQ